jgi:hypothetical protein
MVLLQWPCSKQRQVRSHHFWHPAKLRNYPSLTAISIAGSLVPLSNTIKTLAITLDSHLTVDTQVSSVCKAAFYHIRALRHIRNSLTDDTANVVVALVQSRLDYGNSILYGISKSNMTILFYLL